MGVVAGAGLAAAADEGSVVDDEIDDGAAAGLETTGGIEARLADGPVLDPHPAAMTIVMDIGTIQLRRATQLPPRQV